MHDDETSEIRILKGVLVGRMLLLKKRPAGSRPYLMWPLLPMFSNGYEKNLSVLNRASDVVTTIIDIVKHGWAKNSYHVVVLMSEIGVPEVRMFHAHACHHLLYLIENDELPESLFEDAWKLI